MEGGDSGDILSCAGSQCDPHFNPMAVMTDNGLDRPDLINLQPRHNMIQILACCNTTTAARYHHYSLLPTNTNHDLT